MVRLFILFAGVLVLAGVGYLATASTAPSFLAPYAGAPGRVEAVLQDAAAAALKERGLDWAEVRLDGQFAVLTGEAPKEEERAEARAAVMTAAGPGGLMRGGVVRVRDLTQLAPPVSPYEWRAVKDGARATLSGAVPSRAVRAELVADASGLFTGGVVDMMQIARGAPDELAWTAVARSALVQLANLRDGRVTLKDERLTVQGASVDAATRERITSEIAKLPSPFVAVARIDAPEPGGETTLAAVGPETIADPGGELRDPVLCQDMFDRLASEGDIAFDAEGATIEKESYPLLERLAIAARRCASMQIVVEGHQIRTAEAAVKALSERRAQAVADYIVLKGAAPDRVTAQGVADETEPVKSGTTAGLGVGAEIADIRFRIKST